MADEQVTPETPEVETPEVETPETPETPEGDQTETPETPEKDKDEAINPDDFTPEERASNKPSDKPDDDDDDIDPEDKARIAKMVDKRVSPIEQRIAAQNNEIEVNSFIMDKPEAAPYKPVILKYMNHPAYANIPVKNIAAIVMADRMQKIGAQKEREAQKKVAETKNGGSQHRKPAGGAVDWSKATPQEVEAQIAKVKGQA